MQPIKSFSREGLEGLFLALGQPKFRAKQVFTWLYQKRVHSYDEMTNLSKALREQLETDYPLTWAKIVNKQVSVDGTRKYIVSYDDGLTTEMVAIPTEDRLTVCFSTQVGCAMACSFCATGKEGFTRNLTPGEIVDQIMLAEDDMGMRVTNVVGMGQGEPFLNYDNVLAALRIMNSPDGMGIGARHITVSTCGILAGIEKWAKEPEQFTLAISLHSAVQSTRDELMPRVANQNLVNLKRELMNYVSEARRRVTLEYIMISDITDTEDHLRALESFCDGLLCHVNLIPINSIDESPYKPCSKKKLHHFVDELARKGTEATIRNSRGADIDGACGQLKNKMGK